jgi:hypothetical protein
MFDGLPKSRQTQGMKQPFSVPLLALSLFSACGAPPDATELSDDSAEIRIRPKGNENLTTGFVTLTVPTGSPPIITNLFIIGPNGSETYFGGLNTKTEYSIGGPYRVLAQQGLPWVGYDRSAIAKATEVATFDIKAGKEITIVLPVVGGVRMKHALNPGELPVPVLDFGPKLLRTKSARENVPYIDTGVPAIDNPKPWGLVAKAGTYNVMIGSRVVRSVVVTGPSFYPLPEFSTEWVDFPAAVPTTRLELKYAAHDLPLAPIETGTHRMTWYCGKDNPLGSDVGIDWGTPNPNSGVLDGTWTAGASAPAKTVALTALSSPQCGYADADYGFSFRSFDTTKPVASLTLESIEVDDVEVVVTETGTKRQTKGVVQVYVEAGPGIAPRPYGKPFSTGQAVHVWPGTYTVEVSYDDNAGSKKLTYPVTLP